MADREMIGKDELAVRLTSDISGGLGVHEKGKVLRNLTQTVYDGLVLAGGHDPVKPGTSVSTDKAAEPLTPNA